MLLGHLQLRCPYPQLLRAPNVSSIEQVSESRLSDLKKEITQLEEELEQTR